MAFGIFTTSWRILRRESRQLISQSARWTWQPRSAAVPSLMFTRSGSAEVQVASCSTVGMLVAGFSLVPGFLLGWWILKGTPDSKLPMSQALLASGAFVDDRLRLRQAGSKGTGIFVTASVQQGTVLISIPAPVVLTGKRACEILGKADLDPKIALCALMAEGRNDAEAGGDVFGLQEYLQMLPGAFPSLPFCLIQNKDTTAEMRGTSLLPAARALQNQSEEERQIALSSLGNHLPSLRSKSRWQWAKGVLQTRAGHSFQTALQGDDGTNEQDLMIIPLVDFVNCEMDPSAKCRLGENGQVELVTMRTLQAGTEVTINYGAQSQEEFLFTYGFILPESPIVATSPIPLENDSPIRNALLQLLLLDRSNPRKIPMAQLSWNESKSGDTATVNVSELWVAANVLKASDEEIRAVANAAGKAGALPVELHERASTAARRFLRETLEDWLQELEPISTGQFSGNVHLQPVRAHRSDVHALAAAALRRLQLEENDEVEQAAASVAK